MTATTSTDNPILKALRATPGASVTDLAEAAGVGRSTAGKALQSLEADGLVRRTEGGREAGRRLPDRFDAVVPEEAESSDHDTSVARLGSGQLRALVLDDLVKHEEPVSPSAIAKVLGRSGGAVSNALEKLVAEGEAQRVNDHPRRYVIARS